MKKVSDYFYLKSNIVICVILTVTMVLYAWLVMGSQSKCISEGVSLLGLRFGYTYESVIELFNLLNQNSLNCYNKLLKIWDNIFPFFYGSMYIFWLSLIFKNINLKIKTLIHTNQDATSPGYSGSGEPDRARGQKRPLLLYSF